VTLAINIFTQCFALLPPQTFLLLFDPVISQIYEWCRVSFA
jgi:hypothetical protein